MRHCTLIMVCGIVLGKAKTTKVGMVWYEFNIVNESINQQGRSRAARAAKKLWEFGVCVKIILFPARQWRKFSGNVCVILCATLCAAFWRLSGLCAAKTTSRRPRKRHLIATVDPCDHCKRGHRVLPLRCQRAPAVRLQISPCGAWYYSS